MRGKRGMITTCQKNEACWMNIVSPDFVREQQSRGFLAIQRLGLFNWNDTKKNGLRLLRGDQSQLLRQENSVDQGLICRRSADLLVSGCATSRLSAVQCGETGTTGLVIKQSILHKAFRVFCRGEVPVNDGFRCGQRTKNGLAHGQRIRQAIHGRAIAQEGEGAAGSGWNRRDINQKRTRISDSGQRSYSRVTDLVWRERSIRREHGYVLRVAGRKEERQNQISCDGYVEGLREFNQEERATSGDTVRQVSRDETLGRRIGRDQKARIRTTFWPRPQIYQGAKMGLVVQQGKFNTGRKNVAKSFTKSQQAFANGLFTQRNLWPVVELPNGRLGAAVFRELEGSPEMATTRALRKIRETYRETLGRDSGLQQTREQGAARFCGRAQQQNTSDSTQVLRLERRRVFKAENINLYVGGTLN